MATAMLEHQSSLPSKDLALSLPLSPHITVHIKINALETSTLIFLTTTTYSGNSTSSALGSFVYAMPNRLNAADPLSTPLVTTPSSIDFATRVAKILARRTGLPTYVGCSMMLHGGGGGSGVVEEEIDAAKRVVDTVTKALESLKAQTAAVAVAAADA